MSNAKNKDLSPLVQTVIALDGYFSELSRLGARIEETELKSDSDFEQMQRLMNLFAECGQGVSDEVVALSTALNEARTQAEAAAQKVGARAEQFQALQSERQKKMEAFRRLGEKVQAITLSLGDLKRPEGTPASETDRAKISARLSELDAELNPLIEEAQAIKTEAQGSRMKHLEQSAHSLSQSLTSMRQKIGSFQQAQHPVQ
jgi:chromosome segregation ATPase